MARLWVEQALPNGLGDPLLVSAIRIVAFLRAVPLATGQAAETSGRGEETLPVPHHVTELTPQLTRLEWFVIW